jgi:hypothetical protein
VTDTFSAQFFQTRILRRSSWRPPPSTSHPRCLILAPTKDSCVWAGATERERPLKRESLVADICWISLLRCRLEYFRMRHDVVHATSQRAAEFSTAARPTSTFTATVSFPISAREAAATSVSSSGSLVGLSHATVGLGGRRQLLATSQHTGLV